MKLKSICCLLSAMVIVSCASVPKESVELSATVGRDLVIAHESHCQMAEVMFARVEKDINRFIDDVYAPHQINAAMFRQKELSESNDQAQRNKSLLLAISKAFSDQGTPKLQSQVLSAMKFMVEKVLKDIEITRQELLEPIDAQKKEVIQSINRAYNKMQYANSVVTGHLASIKKVHDAQSEILAEIGIKRDLRDEISRNLANTSNQVGEIVTSTQGHSQTIGQLKEKVENIKAVIKDFGTKLINH